MASASAVTAAVTPVATVTTAIPAGTATSAGAATATATPTVTVSRSPFHDAAQVAERFYDAARRRRLREAIEQAGGNITEAARALKISKTHGMRLTRRLGLNDWARDLRRQSTGRPTGRPPVRAVTPEGGAPARDAATANGARAPRSDGKTPPGVASPPER